MADENNLNDLQRHSAIQDARISNLETKFEMFMQAVDRSLAEIRERDRIRAEEMQDFKNEMREQNKMRSKEIAEIRNDIKEINKSTDAKIEAIRTTIDGMGKHVRNLAITAMVGIIAAGAGIAAMVISALIKS